MEEVKRKEQQFQCNEAIVLNWDSMADGTTAETVPTDASYLKLICDASL